MNLINKNNFMKILIIISFFILAYYNYELSTIFCSYFKIPFDLSFTMISPGIGFNLTIILTITEVGLLIWMANKLKLINY